MKKVFALILVICLAVALAACGAPKDVDADSQQSPQSNSQTDKVQKPANHDENAPPTEEELEDAKG